MLIEFCLPVRNEEKILAQNARRLHDFIEESAPDYSWRIVIIVNGSDDSSAVIARQLEETGGGRFKAKYLVGGGKGLALKEYFRESAADILVFMDIDLAVSLDNLPALITPVHSEGYELVIGSRLMSSSHTDRALWRSLTSRCYNLLSRLVLRHGFSDLQCGFKAMRRSLFVSLQPWLVDNFWFFDTELVVSAVYGKRAVKEIPVNWQENRYDERKSKIRIIYDVWPFVQNVFRLRRRLRTFKYPDNI